MSTDLTSRPLTPDELTPRALTPLRRSASPHVQVKAAGGVPTLDALVAVGFRDRKAGIATPVAPSADDR